MPEAPATMHPVEQERATRAPTDVLRLAVALVVLLVVTLVGIVFDERITDRLALLFEGVGSLPSWLVTSLVVTGQVLGLVLLGGGLVMAIVRRRWILLALAGVSVAVGVGLSALVVAIIDAEASQPANVDHSYTLVPAGEFISAGALAAMAAVVTAAGPWVSRWWRRLGWALVVVAAALRFLGAPIAFDTLVAVLSGWVAGAAAVVLVGAPSRRPTQASIESGLRAVGVDLAELEPASVDARGSTPYFGKTTDGSPLFVKALGEDERSADLMFRIYRRIQPRDLGDEKAFSSLRRAVEHEALVALAASGMGVRTPRLAAFATADPHGYVLAYDAIAGRSLDRLTAEELSDEVLAGVWGQLSLLRAHRVAHRDLRLANVFLAEDGAAWIIDFGFSELAASDLLLATDVAEFLASSTTSVGVERALAAGRAGVGDAAVSSALPRLELALLSGATRTSLKGSPGLLDELRARVAEVAE